MKTSIFLAKLIGPFFLGVGLGILFNRDAVRAVLDEFIRNRALMFLAGLHHLSGRARDRAHPQCVGRGLARAHHHRSAGSPPSPARSACVAPQQAIKFGRSALRAAERHPVRRRDLDSCSAPSSASSATSDNQPARENPHEQAHLARRSRHPEGDHRSDRRFAQGLFGAGRRAGPARADPRDRARSLLGRAAGAGL